MKLKIDNCHYELVKDLLIGLDSLIKTVEKDSNGAIVTLQEGNSQADLINVLNNGPLYAFCANSQVYAI
ncbi:MAG: hypothetical protein RR585_12895 [Coprobacillus sp.]